MAVRVSPVPSLLCSRHSPPDRVHESGLSAQTTRRISISRLSNRAPSIPCSTRCDAYPSRWADSLCAVRHSTGFLSNLIHWLHVRTVLLRPWVRCLLACPARDQGAVLGGQHLIYVQPRGERDIQMPVCVTSPFLNNPRVCRCPYLDPIAD
jgi:hypothetical protein